MSTIPTEAVTVYRHAVAIAINLSRADPVEDLAVLLEPFESRGEMAELVAALARLYYDAVKLLADHLHTSPLVLLSELAIQIGMREGFQPKGE